MRSIPRPGAAGSTFGSRNTGAPSEGLPSPPLSQGPEAEKGGCLGAVNTASAPGWSQRQHSRACPSPLLPSPPSPPAAKPQTTAFSAHSGVRPVPVPTGTLHSQELPQRRGGPSGGDSCQGAAGTLGSGTEKPRKGWGHRTGGRRGEARLGRPPGAAPVTCPPRGLLSAPGGVRPGPGPLLGHLLGDRHDPGLNGGRAGSLSVCPRPQQRRRGGPPGRRRSPGRRARAPPAAPAIPATATAPRPGRPRAPAPPPARRAAPASAA